MPIGTDFEVQAGGNIRHIAGTANYTVLELHRWLQDLADDAQSSGDDFMDITVATPSERSTDNIITLNSPFNIDDTAAEFLYDGSISQSGGATVYAGLVVVGAVETGTQLQITQDEANLTSHWGTGKNADAAANILNRILVKVRINGADIDGKRIRVWARELSDTYSEFNMTMGLGNNTAAIFTADDLNNQTAAATIATWSDITNTEGYQLLDIAGDGTADEPYYSQWDYGTRSANQVYERTKWIARRGTAETIHSINGALFRGISHQFDYNTQTTNFTEDAVVSWGTSFGFDTGTGTAPAVGQYWLNSTSGGVGKVVYVTGVASGTLVIQRENPSGPAWGDNDALTLLGGTGDLLIAGAVTGNTNIGGSGIILADDDNGATGTLWIQLISGGVPASGYVLYQRASAAANHGSVASATTARTVKPEFLGTYTGSSVIGAFGIGIAPSDGIAADKFTTLTNSVVSPPNNQNFTIFGLVATEDRVLVANNNAGAPDFAQLTLNTSLLGATETAVVVTVAIPSDTPSSGKIRVQLDSGIYREQSYTSYTGSTFTIPSTDYTGANNATAPRNVFIGYIDKVAAGTQESFTATYSSDRTLFVRVRDGGATSPIKTFETTATFGSGGGSATAIRTSDA